MPGLQYDGSIHIAVFTSRKAKTGKNKELPWSVFLNSLLTTTRTKENLQDYFKMALDQ